MPLLFEWDQAKARSNRRKHRIGFEEASTVFGDWLSVTIPDAEHSTDEHRWITLGRSSKGNLLVIVHTESDTSIRLISARAATRDERKQYEEND
ncbi:MAG TPA: BrnT family toxin [Silvibacterium sp.]|nr:BrnT family toxin [Silvibacterium sp.]